MKTMHTMVLTTLALGLAAPDAGAHHSPSLFDTGQTVSVEGIVTDYRWANPHVFIEIEAHEPDGTTTSWTVEASWPAELVAHGISRDTLESGNSVRVTGNPARDPDRRYVLGRRLSVDGGPELVITGVGVAVEASASPAPSREGLPVRAALVGTWLTLNPSQTPFIGASPYLNEQGKALAETQSSTDSDLLRAQCIPYSPPFTMVLEGVKGIETRGDDFVIRDVSVGDIERVVQMGATAHGISDREDMQGDSIGHFEGEALVVKTIFNNDEEGTIIDGVPFAGTQLEERFELTPNRNLLNYSYSVKNSEYLALPFAGSVVWGFRPDLDLPRMACDPENASRFLGD